MSNPLCESADESPASALNCVRVSCRKFLPNDPYGEGINICTGRERAEPSSLYQYRSSSCEWIVDAPSFERVTSVCEELPESLGSSAGWQCSG